MNCFSKKTVPFSSGFSELSLTAKFPLRKRNLKWRGEYVVVPGVIHTRIALRHKPAFTATR